MTETIFALLALAGGTLSALVRVVQTRRAPAVTGLSTFFAWLGLISNALWLAYGLRTGSIPQIVGSLAWGATCAYLLWRLADRRLSATLLAGIAGALAGGFALAYGLSADLAGWAGGLITVASTCPQAVKIWTTRDTAGIGPAAWVASLVMGAVWVAYGAAAGLPPVLVLNAVYCVIVAVILAGIVRATRAGRGAGPTLEAIDHLVD